MEPARRTFVLGTSNALGSVALLGCGPLSHEEYEQAHAMHLANHFAAFRAAL